MLSIGRHTYYFENIHSRYNANIEVGNFTSIAPDCVCIGGGEHSWQIDNNVVSNFPFKEFGWGDYVENTDTGKIDIGNDVWLGERVTLIGNIKIGDGAIIGYGSVISKDIPAYAVVVGNPPKIKKYRYSQYIIDRLLKIKWWYWEDDVIKQRLPDFLDINKFVKKYE